MPGEGWCSQGKGPPGRPALRASMPPPKVSYYEVPCKQARARTPDQLGWVNLPKESVSPVHFTEAVAALWTTALRGMGAQTFLDVPFSQSRGESPENFALRRQHSQVSMIVQFSNPDPECCKRGSLHFSTVLGARPAGFKSRLCTLPGQVPSYLCVPAFSPVRWG